jgi:hypothetical protein
MIRHRRPHGHTKKLQLPPLGNRCNARGTTNSGCSNLTGFGSTKGNFTIAVLSSGLIAPEARKRDTETPGNSSYATVMAA